MNAQILNTEVQDFINTNLNTDISKIILKGTQFNEVSTLELIEQIESKAKSKKKLPTWFNTLNIIYPNKLNIEQTTSEIAAKFKSQLLDGTSLIDITGGFGVDSYYFSKTFEHVTHCEINEQLSDIVQHNFKQLGVINILTVAEDGINYCESKELKYDWIYIDPSRRDDVKGKVFFLKDCFPNVPNHLDSLFNYSDFIAIKTSPLLDLSIGCNELKYVKEIHIIAINNEVKELLWILEHGFKEEITIKTVNILDDKNDFFEFSLNHETQIKTGFDLPQKFLYEPNAAILKSGGFKSLAEHFKLSKLHQHSHLYTNNDCIEFPGRTFVIESVIDYNKKNLKALNLDKANITTRNFPETVQQLRQKYSIKDGGNSYLFFTTNPLNKKIVIICAKIS